MRLELRGVGLAFGGRQLFSGLDLALESGESVAVRAPSGAGKTSLLRAVAGLLPLSEGEVRLDGRELGQWGPCAWRAEVAFCLQGGPPMRSTPRALARAVATLRVRRGRACDPPEELAAGWGLDTARWDQPFAELSSGERQRVQLAIALAGRPAVLLLDEPTSALDPVARDAVEATLAGRTALWVTHDPAQAARVASRVVELGPEGAA